MFRQVSNDAIARLKHIDGVGVVALTGLDIVRHRLVREIVEAYDDEKRDEEGTARKLRLARESRPPRKMPLRMRGRCPGLVDPPV